METDPKARLEQIRTRLAELKQEREALKTEREQLRSSLGREPRQRGDKRQMED
jgi:regulator of replication initiation timing